MSSSYRVYCLSHDPATEWGYYRTPEEAADMIRGGVDEHPHCDLLIGRISGALVEVGCPPAVEGRTGHRCWGHRGVEWADADWLRILAYVHQSDDEAAQTLAGRPGLRCWSWERLRRLRIDLQIDVKAAGGVQ